MKPSPPLDSLILSLRDQKVILDTDLAQLYGVKTRVLNQAVKRNLARFPEEFCFQLTSSEAAALRSQFVTSNVKPIDNQANKSKRGGRRTLPYAFTEHGALMAANVLNSNEAVQMSVYLIRAFIKQRELLLAQTDVIKRLAQMDAKLLKHDDALRMIWRELQPLINPSPVAPKPQIGFHP